MDVRIGIDGWWEPFVERDYGYRGYRVYFRRRGELREVLEGRNGKLEGRVIDTPEEEMAEVWPAFVLEEEVARKLIEQFLTLGVRPDVEARNEGELEATKRHIEDLQGIIARLKGQLG